MVIAMSEKSPDCASCVHFVTCTIKFDDLLEDCQHHFERSETYRYDPEFRTKKRNPIRDAHRAALSACRRKKLSEQRV